MKLNTYLSETQANLQQALKPTEKNKCFHFVIGNESCDLDSFTCALVYAWYKHKISDGKSIFIPILNIERELLRIRTEIMYLVNLLNITTEHLFFVDEIQWSDLVNAGIQVKVSLLDHHHISKSLSCLDAYLVEVIDHRPLTGTLPSHILCNVQTVGSCSTLVAEQILENMNATLLENEIKVLITSTILVDTCNFAPEVGKTTAKDIEVFEKLHNVQGSKEVLDLFDQLNKAKFDCTGLTLTDLMVKDPKYVENSSFKLMFSTIHQAYSDFFQRHNAAGAIADFCSSKHLLGWVSLFPVAKDISGKAHKPIAIHCKDPKLRDEISARLRQSEQLEISASDDAPFARDDFVFLKMWNYKASRKQVLPVVQHVWFAQT